MWDDLDPRSFDSRHREVTDPRDLEAADPRDVFTRDLDLPRGLERERVHVRDQEYHLRGSEVRTLATIGAFRVVGVDDLRDAHGRKADLWHGELERLRSAGLVRAVGVLDRGRGTHVVALTERGRELLEQHRARHDRDAQTFHSGACRARELSHDAQLHRAYLRAAERLQQDGGRIVRVVLDHELKREYQRFLQARNRGRPDSDGRPSRTREEIREWAQEQELPMANDRVQFPDFRIEYERPDGRRDFEDVEVTTPHYRGAHSAGKTAAGFTRFRGATGRVGGGGTTAKGAAPFDPRAAEELLE